MGIDYKQLMIVAAFAAAAAGAVTGCESITGLDEFRLDSSGVLGCLDPTGFNGRGCYACEPEEAAELRNACTSARCSPFDNASRIPGYTPGGMSRELTPAQMPTSTTPTTTAPTSSDFATSAMAAASFARLPRAESGFRGLAIWASASPTAIPMRRKP